MQAISKDSEPLSQQNPASTVAPTVNGVGQSQISYKTIISSMKTSSYVRLKACMLYYLIFIFMLNLNSFFNTLCLYSVLFMTQALSSLQSLLKVWLLLLFPLFFRLPFVSTQKVLSFSSICFYYIQMKLSPCLLTEYLGYYANLIKCSCLANYIWTIILCFIFNQREEQFVSYSNLNLRHCL